MNIRQKIAENRVAIFMKMLPDQLKNIWRFAKNNARCGNGSSKNKFLTDILMLTHALEKAFSLPNPRKSFGLKKANSLLDKISRYTSEFQWDDNLVVPISVLKQYIEYHRHNNSISPEMTAFGNRFYEFMSSLHMAYDSFQSAGTYDVTKDYLIKAGKGNFETLATNRFAVRNFSGKPVSQEVLHKALDIARKSPSACNRQSYRVHIFRDEQKNRLLKMQGGANSFYETADSVLLISADANRYYIRESQLGYVDASLFAMTLMYALTYLGIGSIPLTLGIRQSTLERMKNDFDIPMNEMPVLLIAIGNYTDTFKVAMSHRNEVESFTTVH